MNSLLLGILVKVVERLEQASGYLPKGIVAFTMYFNRENLRQ